MTSTGRCAALRAYGANTAPARVLPGDTVITTLVPPPSTTGTDDGAAIAELHRRHAVQRKACLTAG
jgi:hypothetical protein